MISRPKRPLSFCFAGEMSEIVPVKCRFGKEMG